MQVKITTIEMEKLCIVTEWFLNKQSELLAENISSKITLLKIWKKRDIKSTKGEEIIFWKKKLGN